MNTVTDRNDAAISQYFLIEISEDIDRLLIICHE